METDANAIKWCFYIKLNGCKSTNHKAFDHDNVYGNLKITNIFTSLHITHFMPTEQVNPCPN